MLSSSQALILLFVALCLLAYAPQVAAFGAGNIPSYGYLEGQLNSDTASYVHSLAAQGWLADTATLRIRWPSGGAGFLGIGGNHFGGLDIKRVYFGNWLRDYSQAMDVAGLSKLSRQAIINLCMALGFLAHGFVTGEFEVTEERLGVYLPVEHIDNPKDYNDNKDARQVHPALRPPIDPVELEFDQRTGMKNYIANEQGHWDTSAACIRRNMLKCIDMGRRARSSGNENELYEAYRLLGTFLHTLEDLSAHSNWCELMLQKLGHRQVFAHVGDNVRVRAPNGEMVAPLVTGTFGSSDFIHSLLGEAGDHISEASVSDLNKQIEKARSAPSDRSADGLRDMLFQIPGGSGNSLSRDMDNINNMNRGPGAKNPADMSPQELHAAMWQVLTFRDNVCKTIERTIEKIPGLSSLVERITDSINKFVFTTLEPYLKPIMSSATGVLQQGSAQVIDNQDQYRVFDDANASDPTHSLLSKDHFGIILNEPAGELAKIILRHAVKAVVGAWDDTSINPNQVVQNTLTAIHHPYFTDNSPIQRDMAQYMEKWINNHRDRDYVLRALTKDEVRAGRNKRKGHKDPPAPGAYQSFLPTPQQLYGQASSAVSGQVHHMAQGMPGYNQYHQANQQYHHMMGRELQPGGMPESGGDGGYGPPPSSYNNAPPPGQSSYGGGPGFPEPMTGEYGGPPPPPMQQQGYGGGNESYGGFPEPNAYGQGQGPPHHGGGQHHGGGGGGGGPHHGGPGQHHGGQHHGGGGHRRPEEQQYGQQPPPNFPQPGYGGGGYDQSSGYGGRY